MQGALLAAACLLLGGWFVSCLATAPASLKIESRTESGVMPISNFISLTLAIWSLKLFI
jgi:hypothetical protein